MTSAPDNRLSAKAHPASQRTATGKGNGPIESSASKVTRKTKKMEKMNKTKKEENMQKEQKIVDDFLKHPDPAIKYSRGNYLFCLCSTRVMVPGSSDGVVLLKRQALAWHKHRQPATCRLLALQPASDIATATTSATASSCTSPDAGAASPSITGSSDACSSSSENSKAASRKSTIPKVVRSGGKTLRPSMSARGLDPLYMKRSLARTTVNLRTAASKQKPTLSPRVEPNLDEHKELCSLLGVQTLQSSRKRKADHHAKDSAAFESIMGSIYGAKEQRETKKLRKD